MEAREGRWFVARSIRYSGAMAKLSIRIDFDSDSRLGPGKIALLERIAETGSISAAGRSMGMSYRRAWELTAELNALFGEPLVAATTGGRQGGGSILTPLGKSVVERFRSIEREALGAVKTHLRTLEAMSR